MLQVFCPKNFKCLDMTLDNEHENHCKICFNINKCTSDDKCKIIPCPLECGHLFHKCKLVEHLDHTCYNNEIDCINKSIGCRTRIRRKDLSNHLSKCCANVIQCSAFRMRKILNKNKKFANLKYPDPIYAQKEKLINLNSENKDNNLNEILLKQDYEYLAAFCSKNPLKFQRMYGHLIGLKLDPGSKDYKFSFIKYLLKTVKSRIFKDIEAENCIVFNDDIGCIACQTRIRHLETARFERLRKDRYHFGSVLKDVYNYEQFVERKIYSQPEFLEVYKEHFLKEISEEEPSIKIDPENSEKLQEKLEETNLELLNSIELNPVLKLNVAKELPCEAFQLQYESYRLNDSHFSVECDELLRRDEFAEHYSLYHNFLYSHSELIDLNCPFKEYGCDYFKTQYDFVFSKEKSAEICQNNMLKGFLVHNLLSNQLTFNLNNFDKIYQRENEDGLSLLDLPCEVLYDIFDKLDSLSFYSLSLTCKVRKIFLFKIHHKCLSFT